MNIDLLKEDRIIDEQNLFCKIQISYSELGKILRIASGMTSTAGVDGVVGIYDHELVCHELTLFTGKISHKVFRLPFEEIDTIEFKKGMLGLNYQLIVSDKKRKYKLVSTVGRKIMLEEIYQKIINEKNTKVE